LVPVVSRSGEVLGHECDVVYSNKVVDEVGLFNLKFSSSVLGGIAIKLFDSRLGDFRSKQCLEWMDRLRGWFSLCLRRWWYVLKSGCNCFSDDFAYSFVKSNNLLVGFDEFGIGEILDEDFKLVLSCHVDRRCCGLGSGLENNVSES
jgi:hypothetical protein